MAFIDHINLRIPEKIDEALKFYRDLIGLETWKLEEYREGQRTSFFFRIGENALINIRPKEDFERHSEKNLDHF
jgi:catechol 2,3-dioxygenase-like lactoylglutathione lyase family enzyme